ncbi:polysaccharide biosynthesis protein [Sphingomonas cavernae]|uniref:polysaccharide biosynthesis protein n=1 Tax=Sphingomonas cavernae TaxID=2320861 RepID=UPI001EE5AAA5|nr:nucleoside-diphosphate sugar epimerase/dehydratase [Sphingomonas cavernae]
MINLLRISNFPRYVRNAVILIADGFATGAALVIALGLRLSGDIPPHMMEGLIASLPVTIIAATLVYYAAGLHRRVWRFLSLTDLIVLVEAATAAVVCSTLALVVLGRVQWMPLSLPIIQWFVIVVLLGSARFAWRSLRGRLKGTTLSENSGEQRAIPLRTIIVGSPENAEVVLHQLEIAPDAGYRVVGILDLTGKDVSLKLRGVPILGAFDMLEQAVQRLDAAHQRPEALIIAGNGDCLAPQRTVRLVSGAQGLGLRVVRSLHPADPDAARQAPLSLQTIDLTDLLGRPQTQLDNAAIIRAVANRRVLVTGAGGTIGRELVRQIASMNPAQIILLDAGEFNLYSVDMEMAEHFPELPRSAVLCSIRQRQSVMDTFEKYRPELVFHAAALKHVPLVEQNPCAGVMTNVLGTRNVADAARQWGARAMVQVSTDKAVNPVGVMGATKRLGELYCQALDLENCRDGDAGRFMTVRFGNVLGSSGSLIPLFQRQLETHQPLTVTHPDVERYFMTVHEAVQLTLQSTACALEGNLGRGRIFVLDMGAPIKILDIARRMIRLAGLVPERDVPIDIVGLRPGEKLFEELFDGSEEKLPSSVPGVFEAEPPSIPLNILNRAFDGLADATRKGDTATVLARLDQVLQSRADVVEVDQPIVSAIARRRRPMPIATTLAGRA